MKTKNSIFFIILLLASLGQVASDLYLPSLPAISNALAAHVNLVQLSVSLYMYGFAISPLLYGPISDGVGRKLPLLIGLIILLLGSIICLSTDSITWLIVGRFLQGLGAGSGVALSRAILRDVFAKTGAQLARFASYLVVGNISIMASAPLLGGYIQQFLGWRANFAFLTIYAIATLLVVIFGLPETNQYQDLKHLKPKQLFLNTKTLLTNRHFICFSIILFMTYAGILAWLTSAPILLQKELNFSAIDFGWIAFAIGGCYAIGGLLNAKLVSWISIDNMLFIGIICMLVAGLMMLILNFVYIFNAYVLLLPIAVFIFGTSMVFANSFAKAMTPFAKIAGIAGSLFGFMQTLGGAIASSIIAVAHTTTQLPLAIVLTVVSLLALIFLLVFLWRDKQFKNWKNS